MAGSISEVTRRMKMFVEPPAIYLYKQPVDFRKSINGLSAIVEAEMDRSPFSGAVFVFCNRQRDKLKVLYWDKTGFCRSEEHTSELQSRPHLVCRLLLEKKKK